MHDKYKSGKKNDSFIKEYVESFSVAKEFNKELDFLISRSHEILNPLRVLNLFKNIPEEVSRFLSFFLLSTFINWIFTGRTFAPNEPRISSSKRSFTNANFSTTFVYQTISSQRFQSWNVRKAYFISMSHFMIKIKLFLFRTEDDLTIKLTEIVFLNQTILKHKSQNARVQMIVEDWDFLQLQCALYINSELSGIPLSMQVNCNWIIT